MAGLASTEKPDSGSVLNFVTKQQLRETRTFGCGARTSLGDRYATNRILHNRGCASAPVIAYQGLAAALRRSLHAGA